ncbi:hypothetical protein DFH08DRAFT_1087540 [Mycena albidolilacea]|uniref:DUF1479-domain-containing protein n=1 Tax=Mycena albidolilacea TaxID=1033008 RepID=A0AAD7EDR5_9AGAR|nr:hypothetical protein DFH08DRAFT_1087540 [Mycena albidolilacea]
MAAQLPPRFTVIKHAIASTNPNFEQHLTKAWNEVLAELDKVTKIIAKEGTTYIPQVSFADLNKLSKAQIADIKRKGTVVIKDVVDNDQARAWKTSLEEFVEANPHAEGFPEADKQFFHVYWTKAQIKARAHPNMLAASIWLNNLYHITAEQKAEGVDLATPLSYADRFRIRHPGIMWGGAIERWEDENFRACFADILSGEWSKHDSYALEPRLDAQTCLYGRPGQSTVFRAFQGWLAIRHPPLERLHHYASVLPPAVALDSKDILDAKNWAFDMSTPDFPGIFTRDSGFWGLRPTTELHPHLLLDATMTSVPAVDPGDTVFWHCDIVHSVEQEHTGSEDSAVMYIPAVPLTPENARYVERQKDHFLKGIPPPDYAAATTGVGLVGLGSDKDIEEPLGRKAMGLPISVA